MIMSFLQTCAARSRLLLILGLLAGIGLPGVAARMAPWLPHMVALLLVVTAFRIGYRAAFGALSDLRWSLPAVVMLQTAVPVALIGVLSVLGLADTPLALALVLASAAPTISGSASLAIMLRQNPARMMQLLVLGTAAFPLTILPVLAVLPQLADPALLIGSALRVLGIILGAAALGFLLRAWLVPHPDAGQVRAMDGAAILFFAIIVVALMAALGPMLRTDPVAALRWAFAAFALSFGLQALALLLLRRSPLVDVAGPIAIAAGNRNIALFLVSLPAEVMAPVMIFVACWQLPMYLTPFILPRLYGMLPAHE
jgi:ACR3 family arsenite transporter